MHACVCCVCHAQLWAAHRCGSYNIFAYCRTGICMPTHAGACVFQRTHVCSPGHRLLSLACLLAVVLHVFREMALSAFVHDMPSVVFKCGQSHIRVSMPYFAHTCLAMAHVSDRFTNVLNDAYTRCSLCNVNNRMSCWWLRL